MMVLKAFRQEERTEAMLWERKGHSLGTKVARSCWPPFRGSWEERRVQRRSIMLPVEAERSSRSSRASQRI